MRKKDLAALTLLLFILNNSFSQPPNNQYENFGDISSISRPDPSKWQQLKTDFNFSQADINSRMAYNNAPVLVADKTINLQGWRDEEVNAQLVISSKKDIGSFNATVSDLTSGNKVIDSKNCNIGYVYYVIANSTKGLCRTDPNVKYDDAITPDIINFHSASSFVKSYTNRPIWLKIKIPVDAEPGNYKGKVNVSAGGNVQSLDVVLKVSNNRMPSAENKKFFLELWQYPIAEADYYKVKPWSDEHFRLMKPAMQNLKDAGEDVITASFFWDPFNPAARDANEMFIKVVKTKGGQWNYDFTNFDKWVNFMMDLGIKKQITVFGMAPLNSRMYYFDEDSNKVVNVQQGVYGPMYKQFWSSYLKAFGAHLKQKGWFDITTIGFSEKQPDIATALINFIKSVDNNWKISYSGKYYPEIQSKVYDYSLISNQQIPANTVIDRKNKGFITTYYTSCWEKFPNTFVVSDPVDATWLGWNAAFRNMNGYLRFAYDYWTMSNILSDVRSNAASGDRFFIYPGGNTSIRFEMLKDGIEDYEKIFVKAGGTNNVNNLTATSNSNAIQSVLNGFDFKKASPSISRSQQIQQARAALE